jgi:hypothetical protein
LALFAVSTTIASPSPDGQGKIIPVQVTQVTTNSVTLSWETQGDVESRVFYGPTTHYDLKMEGPHGTQTKQHELKLEGLVPGTVYHFRLSDPSQPPQEANPDTDRSFTTLSQQLWYESTTIHSLIFILLVLLVFMVFGLALPIYDTCKTYKSQQDIRTRYPGDTDNAIALIQVSTQPGVGRYSIGITIIALIGLSLLYLLTMPNNYISQQIQIVSDIMKLLTGTLATIVGFYFGARGAEASQRMNVRAAESAPTGMQFSHFAVVQSPGAPPGTVRITWTTSIPTDTQIIYSQGALLMTRFPVPSDNQEPHVKEHTVNMPGLLQGQQYNYQAITTVAGNEVRSPIQTFTVP